MTKKNRPETRKATSNDVAKKAGVSKWTVSRAFIEGSSISEHAKTKVLKAAKEIGYRPNLLARSLTTRRTNLIGLVIDELANPYIFSVLDTLTTKLQRLGLVCVVLNISNEDSYERTISLADQFQVDGLIFLGTSLNNSIVQLTTEFQSMPFVMLLRDAVDANIQCICTDDWNAAQDIAALMIRSGCTKFGYVRGPTSNSTDLKRHDGFEAGLKKSHHAVSILLAANHFTRQEGYQLMKSYLHNTPKAERVNGILFENDILAIGGLDALREQHLLGSIAIVGFDDIELASSPSYELTTYQQPLENVLNSALEAIQKNDGTSTQRLLLKGQLIERKSHLLSNS